MRNINHKIWVIPIVVFLILIPVVIYWTGDEKNLLLEPSQEKVTDALAEDYLITTGEVKDFLKLSDNILLVNGLHYGVSKRYLVSFNGKIAQESFNMGKYGEDDSIVLTYYDINKGIKSEKKIDFLAGLTDYNPNFMFFYHTSILRKINTDEHYIRFHYIDATDISVELSLQEMEKLDKILYYNLETEKFEENPEPLEEVYNDIDLGLMFGYESTDIADYVASKNSNIRIGSNVVYLYKSNDGDRLQNLYDEYDLSKEQLSSGFDLYWFGEPNSRELAYLLAPEGQDDVFKGVTLYGAYSKDGQDHVLEGYDDFFKWYQAPPEEKEE